MKQHVATIALIGMAGNRIGTGFIYDAEDYRKRERFMAERSKPFRVRWRNEECREQTLAALRAIRSRSAMTAGEEGK